MARKMTKKQVDKEFISYILPTVRQMYEQDRRRDIPARCEAYNNFVDSLCKDRLISESQYNKYSIPNNLI
jgi:hypothetical protein